MPKPRVTASHHLLPFDRLSPADFERLCYWLVRREGYPKARHIGAGGQDLGRDIKADSENGEVLFQCKRVKRFGPGPAVKAVLEMLRTTRPPPAKMILVVACNVTEKAEKAVMETARRVPIEVWALSELDERIKRHPDILDEFFDRVVPTGEMADLFRRVETPHDGRVNLWCKIPVGTFWMGSPEGEGGRDEHSRHCVSFKTPFRIAAVPVTNAQFRAFEQGIVLKKEGALFPVTDVTWHRAMEFCDWLAKTFPWTSGARLPTEEEWEYCCRAGTETCYWSGDSEADLANVGWYLKNFKFRAHRVGEKPANRWGLYDVHGNVWEWTLSPKTSYLGLEEGIEVDPSAIDPAVFAAARSGHRVIRGGGCWEFAPMARAAYRGAWPPWLGVGYKGFRVVLPGDC